MLLAPGHLFFCEPVEVPPEMEPGEVADFAELSIESLSPFPPDQLCWGYLHRAGREHLLLYAAHRDRLKQTGLDEIESYAWVLPDFATLAGASFEEETEVRLLCDNSLCLLRFAPGDPVPKTVMARPLGETESPEILAESMRELLPPLDGPCREVVAALANARLDDHGRAAFLHETPAADGSGERRWLELGPSEDDLWAADIRAREFRRAERGRRQTSRLLTRATGWVLWVALALLAGELLLLAGGAWLDGMRQRREAQNPEVLTIQDKHSLITKLEQVARNELRPIEMLEALNTSRPEGIYFTSATAEGENRVAVEGIANTVNELNRYTEQLRRSGRFRLIEDPKALTRSGQTTFTVRLEFISDRGPRRAAELPGMEETEVTAPPEEG